MAGFPFQKPSVMFKLSYFLLFAGLQKNKYISLMAFLVYIPLKMWQEIAKYGRKLVEHGLVESNFGNISIRAGNRMLITRTGAALDEITENNVVEVDIQRLQLFMPILLIRLLNPCSQALREKLRLWTAKGSISSGRSRL